MEKRHFNRKRCLASAVAAVGLSALAYNANASLSLELVPGGGSPDGATNVLNVSNTNPFSLDVYATVTGTGSGRQGLEIAGMSFTSTGGSVLGDFIGAMPISPWNSNGAQAGTQYGTAGDMDLGSTAPATAAGHWIAISDGVTGNLTNNTTYQVKLGTIQFDPSTTGSGTSLNLVPRATTSGALWFEDAAVSDPDGAGPDPEVWTNDKNQSTGAITAFGLTLNVGIVGSPNTWALTGGGTWNSTASWQDGSIAPNPPGSVVTFGGTITGNANVTLDGSRSVGGLLFNNSNSYNITPGSGGTLTVAGTINTQLGNHTISAPLALSGAVTKTGAGNLTISGTQTPGVGASLTLSAANTGAVNVASDPAGLGVTVNGGTLNFSNPAVAAYNVKSLNADESAANALINVPGGAPFQSSLVVVTPGGSVTRAQEEAVAVDIAYGRFLGTSGISTAHTGHDPLTNIVQQFSDGTSIYLFESIEGDANGDGQADGADISVAAGYQDVAPGTGAASGFTIMTQMEGDFNGDFLVDGADIGIIAGRLNQGYNPANGSGGVTAVPEPASLGILAIGATGLLRRRRRA